MSSTRPHKVLYVLLFATANVLSTWSCEIGGVTFLLGSLAMVVAYGLLDIVHETDGKVVARRVIVAAAIARAAVFLGLAVLAWAVPAVYPVAITNATMFVFAEMAMVASQYCIDVPIFAAMKKRLRGPFWARYNLSNLVSQPIAAAIFSLGASFAFEKPYVGVLLGALSLRVLVVPILMTPVMTLWQPSK